MDELTKVKVLLMQEVKDSKLSKGGRILLLNLVAENKDLSETAEILKAFEVISEETKEKLEKYINEAWADVFTGGYYRLAGRAARAAFDSCVRKCGVTKGSFSSVHATGRKMCVAKCKGKLEKFAKIKATEKGRIASVAGLDQPKKG